MTKLELLRYVLASGMCTPAILAFAVAVHLEATRRTALANTWYAVFSLALIAGVSYNVEHYEAVDTTAPFVFAGMDIRTALAAAIWPVALWTVADQLNRFHRLARDGGWLIIGIVAALSVETGKASVLEVLIGCAVGVLVSLQVLRVGKRTEGLVPRSRPG